MVYDLSSVALCAFIYFLACVFLCCFLADNTLCVSLICRMNKQVLGRDRLVVINIAQQLGLEGSYIPRTYIEQIQHEKLVKEVMV